MRDLDNRELAAIQRAMAWERAKGELRSMLWTLYGENTCQHFEDLNKHISNFIATVEDNALHE